MTVYLVAIADDGLRIYVDAEWPFESWGEYPGVEDRVELASWSIQRRADGMADRIKYEATA